MLISSLRGLRDAQQRLPLAAAGALSAAWRGLAADAASGDGEQPLPAASSNAAEPGAATDDSHASSSSENFAGTAQIISIDRSTLYNPPLHGHQGGGRLVTAAGGPLVGAAGTAHKEPETDLVRHLKALIQFRGGPISLAEFMSEVLTNPQHGYYSQRDVFGTAGDFVTSPEISQMFGEMVGIWCVSAWQQLGCPPALHVVELGPGRGTLMADLLRGTAAFSQFAAALRVSMVEVSPHLRGMQWRALRCPGLPPEAEADEGASAADQRHHGDASSSSISSSGSPSEEAVAAAWSGVSGWNGSRVRWHRSLEEVATAEGEPALFIAHEFLDALPVHQFQKTERGWCERLVDVASEDSPLHLRFVLSPGPTPAARMLLPRRLEQLPAEQRDSTRALEVCPQGMALGQSLAQRVAAQGGAALIVDYGQDAPYEASLQAIRRHEFVGLLEQPGSADLSNRVDYSALRSAVEDSDAAADCLGPMPQAHFLLGLGIEARLEALAKGATPQQAEALRAGLRRLVGDSEPGAALQEEGMGFSYQAFCIAQRGLQPWPFGAVITEVEGQNEEEGGEGEGEEPPGIDSTAATEQKQPKRTPPQ